MYTKSARYYDIIYLNQKDFRHETGRLKEIIAEHLQVDGKRLLDVACGTGLHLQWLQDDFQIEGLDINPAMLEIARGRLPEIPLYEADMAQFSLPASYAVIICLFSSIGYVKTFERLVKAIDCMNTHLQTGGILLIEPWFTPDAWRPDTVHAIFIDQPDLKIARINTSLQQENLAVMDMHHLVGTPKGTEHFIEHHELGLFRIDEMTAAFTQCGLDVAYLPDGLSGRGLYLAKKP